MITKEDHQCVLADSFGFQPVEYPADFLIHHFDCGQIIRPIGTGDWMLRVMRRDRRVGALAIALHKRTMRFMDVNLCKEWLPRFAFGPVVGVEMRSLVVQVVHAVLVRLLVANFAVAVGDKIARLSQPIDRRWNLQLLLVAGEMVIAADRSLVASCLECRTRRRAHRRSTERVCKEAPALG